MLRSAGVLWAIRGLVGPDKDYDGAYGFHSPWMDLAGRRRRQTLIGSGVTEAACKTVFSQRLKCSRMRWDVEDGAVILALRLAVLSNTWDVVRNAMFGSAKVDRPATPRQNRQISNPIAT